MFELCIIYLLTLRDGCFYVGMTSRHLSLRFRKHLEDPRGWVRRHGVAPGTTPRVLAIVERRYARAEETRWTAHYMLKFGPDAVRGGAFVLLPHDATRRELGLLANALCAMLRIGADVVVEYLLRALPHAAPPQRWCCVMRARAGEPACADCGRPPKCGKPRCLSCWRARVLAEEVAAQARLLLRLEGSLS